MNRSNGLLAALFVLFGVAGCAGNGVNTVPVNTGIGNLVIGEHRLTGLEPSAEVAPPVPDRAPGGLFSIESQGETRFLVMNWWRGDPAVEGNFRQPGICTGPASTGNCTLGARKTFRPQGFHLQNGMLWLDISHYVGNVETSSHYPLPIELVKDPNACKFSVRHVRTQGPFEFPLNPPGLEILPHAFTMPGTLCASFNQTDATWVSSLNKALGAYLGPNLALYKVEPYPYNEPRFRKDASVVKP